MQRVIKTVYTNLSDLKLAIDGTIVMSNYLRDSLDAMYDGKIPDRWTKVSVTKKVKTNLLRISYIYVSISFIYSQRLFENVLEFHVK